MKDQTKKVLFDHRRYFVDLDIGDALVWVASGNMLIICMCFKARTHESVKRVD